MKKTQFIEILRMIKSTKAFCITLVVVTALGIIAYAGISFATISMKESCETYYDDNNFYDIKLGSLYGFDSDLVEKIKGNEYVEDAASSYYSHELVQIGNDNYVAEIYTREDDLNTPRVVSGRLPEKAGECTVEQALLDRFNLEVGDTIKLSQSSDMLREKEYKIVGSVDLVTVFATIDFYNRGTSEIGDGQVTTKIMVDESSFKKDSRAMICYVTLKNKGQRGSDEYEEYVENVRDELMSLVKKDGSKSYEKTVKEYTDKVEKAQSDYDKYKEELASAKLKISEYEKKLSDAEKSLKESKKKISEERKTIKEAKELIKTNESILKTARLTLDESKAELKSYKKSLEAAKDKLENINSQLVEGRKTLDEGKVKLSDASKQLEEGKEMLDSYYLKISSEKDNLSVIKSNLDIEQAKLDSLKGELENCDPDSEKYTELKEQYEKQKTSCEELEISYSKEESKYKTHLEVYNEGKNEYDSSLALYNEKYAEYEQGEKTYAASLAEYEEKKKSYEKKLSKYNASYDEYKKSEKEYSSKEKLLEKKKSEYKKGLEKLESAETAISKAASEIAEKRKELSCSKEELTEKSAELKKAKEEIKEAKKEIKEIPSSKVFSSNINANPSYYYYKQITHGTETIVATLCVLLMAIALLVCYTTVSRMVTEQHRIIGTQKALGFLPREIYAKYIIYVALCTAVGILLGTLVSYFVMEKIVYNLVYGSAFILQEFKPVIGVKEILAISGIQMAVMCLSAFMASRTMLKKSAIELLNDNIRSGKGLKNAGNSKLPLSMSMILRNLKSNPKIFITTLVSVMGCTILITAVLTCHYAMAGISQRQFDELQHYQGTLTLNKEADEKDMKEAEEFLKSEDEVELFPVIEKFISYKADDSAQYATLIGISTEEDVSPFLEIIDVSTQKPISVPEEGVLICKKMAENYGYSIGDEFVVYDNMGGEHKTFVAGVFERNIGMAVVISEEYYKSLMDTDSDICQYYVKGNENDIKNFRSKIEKYDAYCNYSDSDYYKEEMEFKVSCVDKTILVVLLITGLLSIFVLFNLAQMNIRKKEKDIAVMKVLGFPQKRIYGYVFWEAMVMCTIGLVLGMIAGGPVGSYLSYAVEMANLQDIRGISIISCIIGGAVNLAFYTLTNLLSLIGVKKVKMTGNVREA